MSDPAEKRAVQPNETKDERSGRFAIDERLGTVLPPPGAEVDMLSLEELGAVELEAEHRPEPAGRSGLPRGIVSGVFSAATPTSAPPPVPAAALHHALPRELDARRDERAMLQIEDFSLRPDNPYAASALIPPPRKPFPVAKVLAVMVAVAAMASGVWLAMRSVQTSPPRARSEVVSHRAPAGIAGQRPVSAEREALRRTETAPAPDAPAPGAFATVRSDAREADGNARKAEVAQPPAPRVGKPAAGGAPVQPTSAARSKTAAADASPAAQDARAQTAHPSAAAATGQPVAAADPAGAAGMSPAADGDETAETALPVTPTREQVVAGFDAIQPELARCAAGKRGIAQITATIASSGRISYALIDGSFQGTPEGSCMARIVRNARFPQFSQPTLKVSYPIAL